MFTRRSILATVAVAAPTGDNALTLYGVLPFLRCNRLEGKCNQAILISIDN
jgi:hypothetical protein